MSLYQEVQSACRELDFKPRKNLGQNFLVRESVVEAIHRLVDLSAEDKILEIGSGMGFLTQRLVQVAHKVWAVEVDPKLAAWLKKSPMSRQPSFELVHEDILKVRFADFLPDHKIKVVGNLPYSISSPILFRLFEERERFSSLVLMLQREVAERITASPGTKTYGTLSIWCRVHGQVSRKFTVPPGAFFPKPKVSSTVLQITLYSRPLVPLESLSSLRALVRASFGQRRKTLSNALRNMLERRREDVDGLLREEGIDPRRRGETLTVEEFIRLAGALKARFEDQ